MKASDRATELTRLCGLGASVREEREGFTVLCDPEGNAFCLVDADHVGRRASLSTSP